MKRNRFYIIIFSLLVSLFTFSISEVVMADEENRLDIQVEAGIDGKAKNEQGYPVTLTVTNPGDDFSGDLLITIPKDHQSYGNKVIPIDIASGTTKQIHFSVPGMMGMDIFRQNPNQFNQEQFFLYEGDWQDGQEVPIDSSLELAPTYVQHNQVVIGALTEQPDRLNYLKLTTLRGDSPELLVLQEEDVPSEAMGLDLLDIIIINDYAVTQLPEEKQETIKNWVRDGGVLVIGSELDLNQQLGSLADLAPLAITGKETVETINTFNQLTEEQVFDIQQFELFTGELSDVASITYNENDIPLLVSQAAGKGTVVQLSYDLSHPAFANFEKGNNKIWQSIVSHLKSFGSQQQGYYYGDNLISLSETFSTLANFKVTTLIILFVIYLVLLVPVLYFVLKRMDKREWAWVAIPAFAIISSIALYTTGAKDRLGEIQTNMVSIIAVNEQGVGSGKGSVSFLSKQSGNYILSVDQALNPFPAEGNFYGGEVAQEDIPVIYTNTDKQHVRFLDVEFWSPRSAEIDMPYKEYGKFDTTLTYTDEELNGEVTNDFGHDFDELYLITGQRFEALGALKVGETREITMKASNSRLFTSPMQGVGHQIFGQQNPGQMDQEKERKAQMLNNAIREELFTRDDTPVLVGFTHAELTTSQVNDKTTDQTSLHLFTQPVQVELPDNSVSLSTEINVPEIAVVEGMIHYNGLLEGERFFDGEPGLYELIYQIPTALVEKSFQANEMSFRITDIPGTSYSILNSKTGEYEAITSTNVSFNQDVDTNYINDNAIIFQVNTEMNGGSVEVPNVFLEGVTN
ncbi:hypothetical protein NC661_10245 [Aquibacillus koreensis]|uniref:DUF7408 domain-containing protein n=1 Tax=Aquibacillus koreensis TaxID=279446 RepID=A0A9X3WKZ3_9BACI|nr:hypothetical protein [Aquibacillus koreensis]MCT2534207.1 hypothetical protein [Aquibacillus koreensis]MDC3420748.1 hypothetical protein [Aquibacillus koreensis]